MSNSNIKMITEPTYISRIYFSNKVKYAAVFCYNFRVSVQEYVAHFSKKDEKVSWSINVHTSADELMHSVHSVEENFFPLQLKKTPSFCIPYPSVLRSILMWHNSFPLGLKRCFFVAFTAYQSVLSCMRNLTSHYYLIKVFKHLTSVLLLLHRSLSTRQIHNYWSFIFYH